MTSTIARTVGRPTSAEAPSGSTPYSTEHGTTSIADRVVAKIAAAAAGEVDGTGGAPRRILGHAIGEAGEDRDVHVSAKVDGSVATITVGIAVRYPHSVKTVSDAVAARIRERLRELCNLETARVDVDVPVLITTPRSRARVS